MSLRDPDTQAWLELGIGQARAVASIAKMIRELCDLADLTPEVAIERAGAAKSDERKAA